MYQTLLKGCTAGSMLRPQLGRLLMASREYVRLLVEFEWSADTDRVELAEISQRRSERHEACIGAYHKLRGSWEKAYRDVFPPDEIYDPWNRSSIADFAVRLVEEAAQLAIDNAREPGKTVKL